MIYFNSTQFAAYAYRAVYFNEQDNDERVKYDNDKAYWNAFITKWEHLKDLVWSDVIPTEAQQARLDVLNQQADLDSGYTAQAALFVEHGAILPIDAPPFLLGLQDAYTAETLAYAGSLYEQEFGSWGELVDFLNAE